MSKEFIDGEIDLDIAYGRDGGKGAAGGTYHVAHAVGLEPDITIERSHDLRIAEGDFLLGQLRFGGFQFGLGGPKVHFRRVIIALGGRIGSQKRFLPFEFDFFIGQFRIASVDVGFRFFDRRLVNRGVDLEKFGAFFY